MLNVGIDRSNQTIIVDYSGKILLFINGTMKSDGIGNIELTMDYDNMDYNTLRNFCDEHHQRFTIQSGPVIGYKKEVRIVLKDFNILLYGAFVRSTNIDYNNKLEMGLSFDHIEYSLNPDMFNNYLPYLRRMKLKKIQERIKKQLVMN